MAIENKPPRQDHQSATEAHLPEDFTAYAQAEQHQVQKLSLGQRARRFGRLLLTMTTLLGGGKLTYEAYEAYDHATGPLVVLGESYYEYEISHDPKPELATELFTHPGPLLEKTWGTNALMGLAHDQPDLALQYAPDFMPLLDDVDAKALLVDLAKAKSETFLKYWQVNKTLPAVAPDDFVKLFLPELIHDPASLLKYYSSYSEIAGSDQILREILPYIQPNTLLAQANTYYHLPDSAQIFASAVLVIETDFNVLPLVEQAAGYTLYPEAERLLHKAVNHEIQSHPEKLLQLTSAFSQYPWAEDSVRQIVKNNPFLGIQYRAAYASIPAAPNIFREAFMAGRAQLSTGGKYFAAEIFLTVLGQYSDQPEAEATLRHSLEIGGQEGELLQHVSQDLIRGQEWLADLVRQQAKANPSAAILYFEHYSSLPDAESILHAAVTSLDGRSNTDTVSIVIEHAPMLLRYDWGKQVVRDALQIQPERILFTLPLTDPAIRPLLPMAIAVVVRQDPKIFFTRFEISNEEEKAVLAEYLPLVVPTITPDKLLEKLSQAHWFGTTTPELSILVRRAASTIPVERRLEYSSIIFKQQDTKWVTTTMQPAVVAADPVALLYYADTLLPHKDTYPWLIAPLQHAFTDYAHATVVMQQASALFNLDRDWARPVIIAAAEQSTNETVLRSIALLDKIDSDWTATYLKRVMPTLEAQIFFAHLREFYKIDKTLATTQAEALFSSNPTCVLAQAEKFKNILPEPDRYISRALEELAVSKPAVLVKYYNVYQHLPNAQAVLIVAAEQVVVVNPTDILNNASVMVALPAERAAGLIEAAILMDPTSAIGLIRSGGSTAYHLRLTLLHSQHPELKQLLRFLQAEPYDRNPLAFLDQSHNRNRLAIAAVNHPTASLPELERLVADKSKFFQELLRIDYDPNAPAHFSAKRFLHDQALRVVYDINDRHEQSDNERFASVANYDSKALYAVIVYGEEEVYTSTYNGLLTRLLDRLQTEGSSPVQLLKDTHYTEFRSFIRLAAQYNRLGEWLELMPNADQAYLLQRFVANIEAEPNMLSEAVTIADTFATVRDPKVVGQLQNVLRSEYNRVKAAGNKNGEIVYGILAGMFGQRADITDNWIKTMADRYHIPNVLSLSSEKLYNPDHTNVQQYFFYDDADGESSFQSFLAQYQADEKWQIHEFPTYVQIVTSEKNHRVEIFANRPNEPDAGVNDIATILVKRQLATMVVVHRGHSYHVDETIARIPRSAKIVSLGSCGGYKQISAVLERTPEAYIISTKGTGTASVNDPLFKMLNDRISRGEDIAWVDFWDDAEARLGSNRIFGAYVAPHRNLGMLFLKAYNQERQTTQG